MAFKLNGIDFSKDIYRKGLAVQYKKVYGKNGGTMIDGSQTVDLLTVKTVLSAACNPLTSARLSALSSVCRDEYIFVEYADPEAGADLRLEMIPELSTAKKTMVVNGVTYWEGVTISLTER